MRVAVAGATARVEELERALAAAGAEVVGGGPTPARPAGAEGGASDLATLLVAFEAWLAGQSTGLDAVVVADASDGALAAALAAAKVPLAVVDATATPPDSPADDPHAAAARVIAGLADASTADDPAAILAAVDGAKGRPDTSR